MNIPEIPEDPSVTCWPAGFRQYRVRANKRGQVRHYSEASMQRKLAGWRLQHLQSAKRYLANRLEGLFHHDLGDWRDEEDGSASTRCRICAAGITIHADPDPEHPTRRTFRGPALRHHCERGRRSRKKSLRKLYRLLLSLQSQAGERSDP